MSAHVSLLSPPPLYLVNTSALGVNPNLARFKCRSKWHSDSNSSRCFSRYGLSCSACSTVSSAGVRFGFSVAITHPWLNWCPAFVRGSQRRAGWQRWGYEPLPLSDCTWPDSIPKPFNTGSRQCQYLVYHQGYKARSTTNSAPVISASASCLAALYTETPQLQRPGKPARLQ